MEGQSWLALHIVWGSCYFPFFNQKQETGVLGKIEKQVIFIGINFM